MCRDQDLSRDLDAQLNQSPGRENDVSQLPAQTVATPADFVVIGEVGCGKTALVNALLQTGAAPRKTQSAEFHSHNVIDTPGEFVGRRTYYGALLATMVDVATIVYLQAANSHLFSLPAGVLTVYPGKQLVGVISKIDLADADIDAARRVLRDNGIPEPYFETSAVTRAGIEQLSTHLLGLQQGAAKKANRGRGVA
ncbi:ethanolamine utilization protein [Exilibacterium tricleocarpae]|uniref:Ethanolamine utilization protein n=1 Tax=Exilibacterium tricleocarpae TaxID=2591008 RepID=A0A545TV71_9GAMM|nr:EutP/PduV family microcompartment system protein [Exilibacterium tricleocarpae]TQV81116.1 ethanolamine utilization protein [Exilibacterium tricleocarpae]